MYASGSSTAKRPAPATARKASPTRPPLQQKGGAAAPLSELKKPRLDYRVGIAVFIGQTEAFGILCDKTLWMGSWNPQHLLQRGLVFTASVVHRTLASSAEDREQPDCEVLFLRVADKF